MITPQKAIHYEKYEFKKWESLDAETIVETPVSLTVNGQVWLTFMCTPVDLEAIILKAMDKDPDRRYASALALSTRVFPSFSVAMIFWITSRMTAPHTRINC